jgi:HD-GYP domain-containing protein (c-di-GMP phosphodiesterase class II)
MSSHRPYRPALGINKALKEIETGKNKLYESSVVETCLDLFSKEDFKF